MSGMDKAKIECLMLFDLNPDSSFTEMGFIQKKLKWLFQENERDGNVFCRNSNCMTKNNSGELTNGSI